MFGILKKKLSKLVESISKKAEKKEGLEDEPRETREIIEGEKEEAQQKAGQEEEKIEQERKDEMAEKKKPEKKSIFKKIKEKIVRKITVKKLSAEDIDPILSEMENDLIEADVAVEVAEKIKNDLRKTLVEKEIKRGKERDIVISALKESLLSVLKVQEINFKGLVAQKRPQVVLFLGFNGSGKTTSLAKLGSWLIENGHTCVFAAGDTFRAAAEEQLEIHAKNLGINLIKHKYGADPAAVIYDAIEHAKAKNLDFVLADSAGRTHTNRNLMEQMQKIVRVNRPDLKILVIDSLTGNDAVLQARMFNEVGVDAVIFTKVDVNEKGGAILSVTHELKKPILFLGLGQTYSDFEKFDAEKFVNALLV